MTNREWLNSLPNTMWYDFVTGELPRIGLGFTNSKLGILDWLETDREIYLAEQKALYNFLETRYKDWDNVFDFKEDK